MGSATEERKKRRSGRHRPERGQRARYARIFISPATAGILVLAIFPLGFSLSLTFLNINLFRRIPIRFVGFENWARLLSDPAMRATTFNTVLFVVVGVAVQYVLGLGLALLLNRGMRGQRTLRILFLVPMMVSPIAVGFIIGRMMFGEAFGPINHLLSSVGLSPVSWISTPWMARWTMILVDTWQWTPFIMLLLLAGLQNIPEEPIEAARVDGASAWQIFRYIVFPLLLPVSVTAVLIRALEIFKMIDIIRVVTGGGPGRATESVTVYVFELGSKKGDLSYAATGAYALLILAIVGSLLFLLIVRRFSARYGT